MQLAIGNHYLARGKSDPFEDLDGSLVEFESKTYRIKILPKPEKVIVDDGARKTYEPLPDHLKGEANADIRKPF